MNYVQMWLFMTNQSEPLRQASLLMLLAGGIGHGDSLLQGLRAHETESKGIWGSKIGQLRMLMEQGHSLSSALSVARDMLPDTTISAIRIAEGTGALADVLMDEARRISRSSQRAQGSSANVLIWAAMTFTVMIVILSFLMLYIVPKFHFIFDGFGVELPAPTAALMRFSDSIMTSWFIIWLPISGAIAALCWWMWTTTRQRMMHGYHRSMEHWPRYWVPGLLRQLSLAVASGSSLGTALDCAMQDLPPGRASRTVSALRHRVNRGEEAIAALAELGLVKGREAAFLRSSMKTRHLDWGLRHLADAIERKRNQRLRRIPQFLGPAIILIVGTVVLGVLLAFFLPLIKLINDLA